MHYWHHSFHLYTLQQVNYITATELTFSASTASDTAFGLCVCMCVCLFMLAATAFVHWPKTKVLLLENRHNRYSHLLYYVYVISCWIPNWLTYYVNVLLCLMYLSPSTLLGSIKAPDVLLRCMIVCLICSATRYLIHHHYYCTVSDASHNSIIGTIIYHDFWHRS